MHNLLNPELLQVVAMQGLCRKHSFAMEEVLARLCYSKVGAEILTEGVIGREVQVYGVVPANGGYVLALD